LHTFLPVQEPNQPRLRAIDRPINRVFLLACYCPIGKSYKLCSIFSFWLLISIKTYDMWKYAQQTTTLWGGRGLGGYVVHGAWFMLENCLLSCFWLTVTRSYGIYLADNTATQPEGVLVLVLILVLEHIQRQTCHISPGESPACT